MSRSEVVYVAGPYRATTPWGVEQNVRRAEEVALELARRGYVPLCPHTMYRFFDGQCDDAFWLGGTLELMRRCDLVVMVDGWEASQGSRGEHAEAKRLRIPVLPAGALVDAP